MYLLGLAASLVAMTLLVISALFTDDRSIAYPLLLTATAFVGAGFGLTVPSLNTFTAAFHPSAIDRSILALNALLGLGTALAPVFVAVFVGLGFWWGLPVLSAVLLGTLLVVSAGLALQPNVSPPVTADTSPAGIPPRFWLFATFAVLYGICETMNGNWAQPDMTSELGASTTVAALALTAFWSMVTVGRILFASIQRWFPTHRTYHVLPFVLAAALGAITILPSEKPALRGAVVRAWPGSAVPRCSLSPSASGRKTWPASSAAVAGGVIAFYQLGYGIAAFGAGPLQSAGVELPTIFGFAAIAAIVMGILSFWVARPMNASTTLHPRPS